MQMRKTTLKSVIYYNTSNELDYAINVYKANYDDVKVSKEYSSNDRKKVYIYYNLNDRKGTKIK